MTLTIEEVLARRARLEAAKHSKPELERHLPEIVTLLNSGAGWVDVMAYLTSWDVKSTTGAPISRTPLKVFCVRAVPAYDLKVGTPPEVVAGRRVSMQMAKRANAATRAAKSEYAGLMASIKKGAAK